MSNHSMIVSKLVGGLGNQMFQYAAGRALSLRLGVPLYIDRRSFNNGYKLRNYELEHFQIVAQDAPVGVLPTVSGDGFLSRVVRRWLGSGINVFYREKSFAFDVGFEQLGANTYIEGYWQSERYFFDVNEQIRKDFKLIESPSGENQVWLDKINNTLSVSLHVRRGDYVSNPVANQVHGTCGLDYYVNAIAALSGQLQGDPEFFVFSDDPAWVREHLSFGPYRRHFIDHNGAQNGHEDLRLMTACKHNIIANSTFSWWGAWLNPHPRKIVIAPARWFRDETMNDADLIPEGWLRV